MAILLLADGRFKGDGLLCDAQNLAHLVNRHIKLRGDFLRRRVTPVFVQKLAVGFLHLVDGFHHMHGDTMVRA